MLFAFLIHSITPKTYKLICQDLATRISKGEDSCYNGDWFFFFFFWWGRLSIRFGCSSLCWINRALSKNKQKLKPLLFWEVWGVQLSFCFVFRSFSNAYLENLCSGLQGGICIFRRYPALFFTAKSTYKTTYYLSLRICEKGFLSF